jgi:gamma-D-glutamyl-L-lysine dipeptidyl-peptidase
MKGTYFFCCIGISPLRSAMKDSSEMVSQLLFGEVVELIESDKQWRKVRSMNDQYEGWTDEKSLLPLTEKEMRNWLSVRDLLCESTASFRTIDGNILLTKGAYFSDDQDFSIGSFAVHRLSDLHTKVVSIEQTALSYLNAPYLWGGKTLFGIDCSGLTQMVFRFHGIQLPRDANQQAEDGQEIPFELREAGDLAFFQNDSGRITHVGIIISEKKIIHAHGKVRIDELSKNGIYNAEKETISHHFAFIKRYH